MKYANKALGGMVSPLTLLTVIGALVIVSAVALIYRDSYRTETSETPQETEGVPIRQDTTLNDAVTNPEVVKSPQNKKFDGDLVISISGYGVGMSVLDPHNNDLSENTSFRKLGGEYYQTDFVLEQPEYGQYTLYLYEFAKDPSNYASLSINLNKKTTLEENILNVMFPENISDYSTNPLIYNFVVEKSGDITFNNVPHNVYQLKAKPINISNKEVIQISWEPVSEATFYRIYSKTNTQKGWEYLGESKDTQYVTTFPWSPEPNIENFEDSPEEYFDQDNRRIFTVTAINTHGTEGFYEATVVTGI